MCYASLDWLSTEVSCLTILMCKTTMWIGHLFSKPEQQGFPLRPYCFGHRNVVPTVL